MESPRPLSESAVGSLQTTDHSPVSNSPIKSDQTKSSTDNPQPPADLSLIMPETNAAKRIVTKLRREAVLPEKAPQMLHNTLEDKLKILKQLKTSTKDKHQGEQLDTRITKLQNDIQKVELSIAQIAAHKTNSAFALGSKEAVNKLEKQLHKELIALDAPKLTKMGAVASVLSGIVFGVGVGALTAGLVSNPVGWAIIGLGAVSVFAVLLYQRRQGTAKEAALYAFGGALVGGGLTFAAGAGALGATAAVAVKSAGTAVNASLLPAMQTIGNGYLSTIMGKHTSLLIKLAANMATVCAGIVGLVGLGFLIGETQDAIADHYCEDSVALRKANKAERRRTKPISNQSKINK